MTDLREGRIQAFLDDEMDADARRTFIGEMARDDALSAAVRSQKARIARVHAALDAAREAEPRPTVERRDQVLQTVLARVQGPPVLDLSTTTVADTETRPAEGAGSRRERVRGSRLAGAAGLAKAAGLLLFATGVAAATIPGSPLRTWIGELGDSSGSAVAADAAAESAEAASAPERMGIRLPARSTAFEVVIATPLSEPLRVSVVDEPMLEVMADEGTSFATSDGRIEIHQPRGAVTVRIPRAAENVAVRVAGSVFLRKTGDRLEVLQEGVDTLPSELVFQPSPEGTPRE